VKERKLRKEEWEGGKRKGRDREGVSPSRSFFKNALDAFVDIHFVPSFIFQIMLITLELI
jgi:hypothetical protein